jgi:hypothetical protein
MKTSGNVPDRSEQLKLELWIGDEVVEVELDQAGIRFRQSGNPEVEGLLPWDVAIGKSLLGEARRRASAA